MILAETGHRPDKLGGYDAPNQLKLIAFAEQELRRLQPHIVITGMAIGWDTALAEACILRAIPFWAYVPFAGQESRWPMRVQNRYHELLMKAERIRVVSEGPFQFSFFQLRNEAMVDDCHEVLALWNGSPGGTAKCVRYAEQVGRHVDNCWSRWENFK